MTCEFKAPSYRPLMFHSNYSFQNFPGGPGTCWHNYNNHAYPFKINVYVNVDLTSNMHIMRVYHVHTHMACMCDCVCVFTSMFLSWQVLAIIVIANLRRYVYVKHWNEAKVDSNFTATGSQLALSRNTTHADAIDAQRWWPQANNNGQPWPNNPIKFI